MQNQVSKREKDKLSKYDARGIQTLFRTMSRNHYNLLRMVDNKSSIILTMNSIIISLIMGAMFVAPEGAVDTIRYGSRILLNFSILSMLFAIISMLPHKYIGRIFSRSEYKGSLYAGNFSSLRLEEFKNEFDRIMSSGRNVYDEMLTDMYFLGRVINGKQRMLLLSVVVFVIGLVWVFVYFASQGIGAQ